MEGVRCCEFNTVESLGFKGSHGCPNRFCFSCNYGHFRRVFVGCDDVTFSRFQNCCNLFIWSSYACHESFVVNFNRAHFCATGCSSSESAVHVQDSRRHQGRIFSKGMASDHVRVMPERIQGAFNGEVSCKHGWLSILSLLQFVLSLCSFFSV